MDSQNATDWGKALRPLLKKYKDRKHPLEYKNIYQLLVMVVLSAQDSDAHINKLAPALFEAFPDMKSLSKASTDELMKYVSKVRGHKKKIGWLQDIASQVGDDKKIPLSMTGLDSLKGIGRKSANVIMREAGKKTEGVMCDLHVVRVSQRLGIAKGKTADKIESELMDAIPKNMWTDAGMALSFLGRETCRPTNPKHEECVLRKVCEYCMKSNSYK